MLKSIQSVAYLVGYLAALNYFTDRYDSFAEAAGVTEDLNEKIDWDVYLKAIDLMKIDYIKNVDPKTWPAYRNIYLRVAHHFDNSVYSDPSRECIERNLERFYLTDFLKDHAKEIQCTNSQLKKDIETAQFKLIERDIYEYMIESSENKTRERIHDIFGEDVYISN